MFHAVVKIVKPIRRRQVGVPPLYGHLNGRDCCHRCKRRDSYTGWGSGSGDCHHCHRYHHCCVGRKRRRRRCADQLKTAHRKLISPPGRAPVHRLHSLITARKKVQMLVFRMHTQISIHRQCAADCQCRRRLDAQCHRYMSALRPHITLPQITLLHRNCRGNVQCQPLRARQYAKLAECAAVQ